MYAVQEGISLAKNDPEAKVYLLHLMDDMERVSLCVEINHHG